MPESNPWKYYSGTNILYPKGRLPTDRELEIVRKEREKSKKQLLKPKESEFSKIKGPIGLFTEASKLSSFLKAKIKRRRMRLGLEEGET